MLTVRKANERGHTQIGWLNSWYSFSFGSYHDPRHKGFRDLLVINEDRVAPGQGFGRHGHADMEILSYVVDGMLGHRDSTGTDGVIRPGEIQRMSAGTGIQHSEMNASADAPVHFLQIWIQPGQHGIAPGYEQVATVPLVKPAQFDLIAGPNGGPGAVMIHADARLYRLSLEAGATFDIPLEPDRHAWLQVTKGTVDVAGEMLDVGDGLATDEARLFARAAEPTELLMFDLA